jgi:hypothetical protein
MLLGDYTLGVVVAWIQVSLAKRDQRRQRD